MKVTLAILTVSLLALSASSQVISVGGVNGTSESITIIDPVATTVIGSGSEYALSCYNVSIMLTLKTVPLH
jgi:hypothetical protein